MLRSLFLVTIPVLFAFITGLKSLAHAEDAAAASKKICDQHFPGDIQKGTSIACQEGFQSATNFGNDLAAADCRFRYGEEPSEVYACLLGIRATQPSDDFRSRFQLCSETYPFRTELDAHLLASCLSGIWLTDTLNEKPRPGLCDQVTNERSFIGPCQVGVALQQERELAKSTPSIPAPPASGSTTTPEPTRLPIIGAEHNKLCERYFDQQKFHLGYRSCLNAKALQLNWPQTLTEALGGCDRIVSDSSSDHEKASCFVGVTFLKSDREHKDNSNLFARCGENKVRFEDIDFLGCLAGVAIESWGILGKKDSPEQTCKNLFKGKKSSARLGCTSAARQGSLLKPHAL